MKRDVVVLIPLLCLAATASAISPARLLSTLSLQLREARTMPPDPDLIRGRCPDNLPLLVGIRKRRIRDALGAPDMELDPSKERGDEGVWFYAFVNTNSFRPRSDGAVPKGGGFAQVMFTFDASARVVEATCTYAE